MLPTRGTARAVPLVASQLARPVARVAPPALAGLARPFSSLGAARARRAGAHALVVLAGVVCLLVGILPHTGLYRTVTVLSSSMEPAFGAGDLIVVTPQPLREVRVGQVITYEAPVGNRHVVTHRVVRMIEGGDRPVVVTRGDANAVSDPWAARLEGTTAWRYRFAVPFAGGAVLALRRPAVRAAALFVVPPALAASLLLGIWRPRRRPGEVGA